MSLGAEATQPASWEGAEGVGKKKKRRRRMKNKDRSKEEGMGCWMKLRQMGGCIPSRAKVDTSISSATTLCGNLLRRVLLRIAHLGLA